MTNDTDSKGTVFAGGLALVLGAGAFMGVFVYLANSFQYPDVLDGNAKDVLPALLATGDPGRTAWACYALLPLLFVPAGVAAFEALKKAVKDTLPKAAITLLGERGGSHPYDMGAAEAAGFHASTTASLVRAAGEAQKALAARFGTADPASWRDPRKLYDVQVQGVATAPRLKFYDRGTFSQAVELGP